MSRKIIDVTGQVFDKLTVIKKIGSDKKNNILWECQCSCGNKRICNSNALRSGWAKSCGCGVSEIAKKELQFMEKAILRNFAFGHP